jgi:uncharacterized protein YbjT (DUF2867 family)
VAGATGLVGRELVRLLAGDERWDTVHLVGRRALPDGARPAAPRAKLVEHVIDFKKASSLAGLPAVDDVFICLGTTMRDAGSREAFRQVDFDHVVGIAHMAHRQGAERLAAISALGADRRSRSFYLRTKGDAEAALAAIGFASTTLLRPSVLDGERGRRRPLEDAARVALHLMGRLVPARWRPVAAGEVAAAMRDAVARGRPGLRVIESDRISARP